MTVGVTFHLSILFPNVFQSDVLAMPIFAFAKFFLTLITQDWFIIIIIIIHIPVISTNNKKKKSI